MRGVLLRSGERPSESTRRQVERLRAKPMLSPAAWARYNDIQAAVTVPASKMDYSQLTAIRLSLRDKLQTAVMRTMGQAPIIRDLMPSDVSGAASAAALFARLTNKNALVANTWFTNDLGFRALPINTAVGIYGYIQLASIPLIDAIAFTQGSVVTLGQFFLDPIYADQDSSIGYFDPPIAWAPQQSIGVNLLAASAVSAAAEAYGLIGYVAEPAGQTVAPDQTQLV
jgi:hypothetical protein